MGPNRKYIPRFSDLYKKTKRNANLFRVKAKMHYHLILGWEKCSGHIFTAPIILLICNCTLIIHIELHAKGQLISECPLDILNFPKNNEKI